mmetsp:Transcript_1922/g.3168  ORF Transcript_1922/g.3168 Transcript_1922/m.3168 type:complete len:229 (-) Transcript_1922:1731-2417(-)
MGAGSSNTEARAVPSTRLAGSSANEAGTGSKATGEMGAASSSAGARADSSTTAAGSSATDTSSGMAGVSNCFSRSAKISDSRAVCSDTGTSAAETVNREEDSSPAAATAGSSTGSSATGKELTGASESTSTDCSARGFTWVRELMIPFEGVLAATDTPTAPSATAMFSSPSTLASTVRSCSPISLSKKMAGGLGAFSRWDKGNEGAKTAWPSLFASPPDDFPVLLPAG